MGNLVIHSIRFVLFVFFQVLVFNQIEIGWGIYPMIYPLFIFLLPFEMKTVPLMFLAFLFGLSIDVFSDTYGLHASAAIVFAFFRPLIFKLFAPRDGYENVEESTVYMMGNRWFLFSYGLLLLIHHSWFFAIEHFKWNELFLIIRKTALSVPLSYLLSLLIQFVFFSRKKYSR